MKVMLLFSFFKYKMKLKYWLFFEGGSTYAPAEVLIGLGGGVEGALLSISAARIRL